MRHALLTSTLVLAALTGPPVASARYAMRQLRHIVLDPGHGGHNRGALGPRGVHEKYLTLPIALQVKALLERHTDAKVTVTRATDVFVGLRERTRMANRVGGDLLLSIHCNASHNKKARGVEVYFLSADAANQTIAELVAREEHGHEEEPGAGDEGGGPPSLDQVLRDAQLHAAHARSEQVAEVILDQLHAVLGAPRRGVFQAPFAVLKGAAMPAVVVEVGFLTHADEGPRLLKSRYLDEAARAIYRAIVRLDRKVTPSNARPR